MIVLIPIGLAQQNTKQVGFQMAQSQWPKTHDDGVTKGRGYPQVYQKHTHTHLILALLIF